MFNNYFKSLKIKLNCLILYILLKKGKSMKIGILKEIVENETRVSISPDVVKRLCKLGYEVLVQKDAGGRANFLNEDYEKENAIISNVEDIYNSDIIIKVQAPTDEEISKIKSGATIIGTIWPAQNEELLKKCADKKINILAMDSVPRISRAQKMDTLSSMANISGYRAVIEASNVFGRFLGGQITAAGKISPAKVLIIGAGVAGLSAIGTAGNLGAIVRAFDTRPEVKDQVESMGGSFLQVEIDEDGSSDSGYAKVMSKEFIEAEMALFLAQAKEVDIIITTALIPGKPSPKLITEEMIKAMKTGSVVVDLASERGGNCVLTQKDKVVVKYGVNIIGYTDLATRLPEQASRLYASNIAHLLSDMTPNKDGCLDINFDDEVIRGVSAVKDGKITFPPPPIKVSAQPKKTEEVKIQTKKEKQSSGLFLNILMIIFALGGMYVGSVVPDALLSHISIFVLSCFIGYQIIWSVAPALHTPLMGVTNAISGIIIVGGLVQVTSNNYLSVLIASIAIFIAMINIVGGFSVTQKTLRMFSK
jgi:NAD(P) transhydrogenase subunit alpha